MSAPTRRRKRRAGASTTHRFEARHAEAAAKSLPSGLLEMRPNDDSAQEDTENRQRDGHRKHRPACIRVMDGPDGSIPAKMAVLGGNKGRPPADAFAVIRFDIDSWMQFQ
jgi:hypothetical protein